MKSITVLGVLFQSAVLTHGNLFSSHDLKIISKLDTQTIINMRVLTGIRVA
jgi:hypothetical protein